MRVTIIETGRPPDPLGERFPSYPSMFAAMFDHAEAGFDLAVVRLIAGAQLPPPETVEAVLITGSPIGVYDPVEFLDPLRAFIQELAARRIPMVGVCFGHQIMADALGGVVQKSGKGWGIGRHRYEIIGRRQWMVDAGASFALAASHQDQVMSPPPGAETLARSDHTEHAMLAYTEFPAISVQGHPEFSDPFAAALYGVRRGLLGDDAVDAAINSLAEPDDNALVAEWFTRFLASGR